MKLHNLQSKVLTRTTIRHLLFALALAALAALVVYGNANAAFPSKDAAPAGSKQPRMLLIDGYTSRANFCDNF
jgi:hypothetical protein